MRNLRQTSGTIEERRAQAQRSRLKVAGMYRGMVRQGNRDPLGEISHELDITIVSVQRYLQGAGQPYEKRDVRNLKRMAIIEEVEFFLFMGRGLHEIAQKVGMSDKVLATNLRAWKERGDVPYSIAFLDQTDMATHHKRLTPF
jgi:hypothetical protein